MSDPKERQFLHDLANPLATALFVAELATESVVDQPELAAELRKVMLALEKIKVLLHARRTALVSEAEGESP
jgi:hypothetical protein